MALAYTVEGVSVIDDADATTDWDAVRWAGTGAAPSAALDTTVFFETTGSIAAKLNGNNWKAGLAFNWYNDQSSVAQDLTVSGSELLGMLVLMTTESVALTRAAGGMFVWVSSDTTTGTTAPTEYSEWWVGGSDVGTSGWKQFLWDTRKPPSFTAGGGSTVTITSSSATTNEILTASVHGLFTGQTVTIASHTGSTPSINRADWEIRVTDSTHFIIVDDDGTDLDITVGGTGGTVARDGADLTAIRRFGFGVRNIASVGNVKADNTYCDFSFNGFPIYQVINNATPAGDSNWQGFIDNSASNGNGLIESASGSVLCNCGFRFGASSQTEALTFTDTSPFNIVFRQHLYYGGANRNTVRHLINYEDLHIVEAVGGSAAGDETTVSMGVLVGTGDDRQGVNGTRFSTEDIDNQTFKIDMQTDIADIVSVDFYGCEFIGGKDGVFLDDGNKTTLIGCLFQRCGLIDVGTTNNGAELFDITVLDPDDRVNEFNDGLKWPGTTTNISDCSFVTTEVPTTQSHVLMPAAGAFTFDNIKFFGSFTPASDFINHLRTDLSGTLSDEYDFGNANGLIDFDNGTTEGLSQSWLNPSAVTLRSLTVGLALAGTLTGTITAKVYSHSGTFGTSSIPNALLATSEGLDITKLSSSNAIITFPFNDNVALSASTHYVWTIEGTQTGDGTNKLRLAGDTSSPTHAGNAATWDGISTWTASGAADFVFEVSSTQIKINGTNGANPDWVFSTGDRTLDEFSAASAINQVGILTLVAVTMEFEAVDSTDTAISGTQVSVYRVSDNVEVMAPTDTNGSGIASSSYTGSLPLDIYYRYRKSSTGAQKYFNISGFATITAASGVTVKRTMFEDDIADPSI